MIEARVCRRASSPRVDDALRLER